MVKWRLDNKFNEKVNPTKEALIVAIIYLVLSSMLTTIYDIRFFILISTVIIFLGYMIGKRIKKINSVGSREFRGAIGH